MSLDFSSVVAELPTFLAGTLVTIVLTATSMAAAISFGLLVALGKYSGRSAFVIPIRVYQTVIRNTPELVQLYLVFYALPAFGLRLEPFATAVLVLGAHYAAFIAEIFLSGIASIDRTQWEAAHVLRLRRRVVWARVILPQVFERVTPPIGNYVIAMLKITSLASAITVHELFWAARDVASQNFRYVEAFASAGLIYLILSLVTANGLRRLESRLRRSHIATIAPNKRPLAGRASS